MLFDWHALHCQQKQPAAMVDPRRRLRIGLASFAALLVLIFARAVQLELTQGAAFRAEAAKPIARQVSLPALRGRILARDGTVLACDKKILALAVHYRYLQEPPDPRWLRQTARARLAKSQWKDAARLALEESRVRADRAESARDLARLCGLAPQQWDARAEEIRARVGRIAAGANERRKTNNAAPADAAEDASLPSRAERAFRDFLRAALDDGPPTPVTVSEELDYHVLVDDVPPAVAAEVQRNSARYPGVKIIEHARRTYPAGTLFAHVLGYLGPVELPAGEQQDYGPDDLAGRAGVERQYERWLRGRRGVAVEHLDHNGRVCGVAHVEEPIAGEDLVLTVDAELQRAAEELLDSALERRALQYESAEPAGGAIVVMDIRDGAVLAAASAPRFDPNLFVGPDAARRTALLTDSGHPFLDRTIQMALPPGSVFKTATAMALLENGCLGSQEKPLECRGYLHDPDHLRCALYVRQGIGHGPMLLGDALAQSCNVYFFHYAEQLGAAALADWSQRLGFGRPTGIDLPGEAAGAAPTPERIAHRNGRVWRSSDTLMMAVGQGPITATPLQVVRLMAAVANGGRLVTPHVLGRTSLPAEPIAGLHASTLTAVAEGLRRVVADPNGTAHASVFLETVAVAGKTGTASTGDSHAEHAWFAGYVPAQRPKFALVVVLEHAGDAAVAAGPVVKRLVLRMEQMGLL
ncbi:MAG: penicillin-binding transpeptidase domain-containing protein [Thermoguttaceae bacterium]|jgi:penicillin-binding protein 2